MVGRKEGVRREGGGRIGERGERREGGKARERRRGGEHADSRKT